MTSASVAQAQGAPALDPMGLLLQLSTGYMPTAALHAAAQLKIADLIGDGTKSAADLARAAGANEDALYRMLRALAGTGIFSETGARIFANTPASFLLRTGAPGSVRDIVLWIANPLHLRVFAEFEHSVTSGRTSLAKLSGLEAFEYFDKDRAMGKVFNAAMTNFSSVFMPAVLEAYDFGSLGTLADIGGNLGYLMILMLKKWPAMRGIVFDLPHVVNGARPAIEAAGVASRCEVVGGSFFDAVPAADSYLMKFIIHDWDAEKSIAILKNCAKAMRGNGKVLLIELVVNSGNEGDMAKWIDMEMLAMAGGKERTEAEFADLFAKAGLRLSRVVRTQSPFCVIEAVKA